eukprot:Skav218112  [mRNA]  locus=scaffold759:204027:222910:- [translate_table: standard]
MQSGFGMLEMGCSARGHEVNIMLKNVYDVVCGALAYYILGFGISYGSPSNGFMGMGDFFVDTDGRDPTAAGLLFTSYIFQFSFAATATTIVSGWATAAGLLFTSYIFQFSPPATATTIVSGCLAMRCKFLVYCIYSFYAVICYAFVAHWVWSDTGWLGSLGAHDFAGSGPVHLLGAINGLVAILWVGPRTGRFDGTRPAKDFAPSSPASILFGLFMLWNSKWILATRAAVTTVSAAAGGGLAALPYTKIRSKGLVLPEDGAAKSWAPWWYPQHLQAPKASYGHVAMIIGLIGSLVANSANLALLRLKIDDPVGAVGVHGAAGMWGVMAVGLFADADLPGIEVSNGLFRGGGFQLLGVQLLMLLAIIGWTPFFWVIGALCGGSCRNPRTGLRVDPDHELEGLDYVLHGCVPKSRALAGFGAASGALSGTFASERTHDVDKEVTEDKDLSEDMEAGEETKETQPDHEAKNEEQEAKQESLQAGVITDGRRKAAAAADERFREQVAMERGLLRVKKAMNKKFRQEPEAAAAAEPVTEPPTEGAGAPMDPAGDAFAGLASLAASAQLPKRLGNCLYDASGRNWVPRQHVKQVPKAQRPLLLSGFTHQIEKSRTGAAACKRCGAKIEKQSFRMGYPVKDQRGEYGAIVNWFHLECGKLDAILVGYAKMGEDKLTKMVLGWDGLQKDERTELTELLLSPLQEEAPEQLPAEQPARNAANIQRGLSPTLQHPKCLGWMLEREADKTTRGGILADEMGMGKTLQTISLLLAGHQTVAALVDRLLVNTSTSWFALGRIELLVGLLPTIAPGSIEVRLFYGTEKKDVLCDLMDDKVFIRRVVVLTTYQTLEADYRRQVNLTKVKCEWCGRLFQKSKLFYHQRYFCGPEAQRTEKQMKAQRKADYKDGLEICWWDGAHYMCSRKGCDCVSLHYRFDPETSLCRKCGHTKMQHRSHFVTEVSNPIKNFGFCGAGKDRANKEVMKRFKEHHQSCQITIQHGQVYHIDFSQKSQMNLQTKKERKIRCFFGLPPHWEMTDEEALADLKSASFEPIRRVTDGDMVSKLQRVLNQSLRRADGTCCTCPHGASEYVVKEAYQIENLLLLQNYRNYALRMLGKHQRHGITVASCPPVSKALAEFAEGLAVDQAGNQRLLLHGTRSFEIAKTIAMEGFDNRAEGLYGRGTYFAAQTCKSAPYAIPNGFYAKASSQMWGTMIVARVAIGDAFHTPGPPKQNGVRADSIIAEVGIPNGQPGSGLQAHVEFVTFDPAQAYPEFIVRYTEE